MDIINVKNLCKSYKVARRDAGFKSAIKSFFKRDYKTIKAVPLIMNLFDRRKKEAIKTMKMNTKGKKIDEKVNDIISRYVNMQEESMEVLKNYL